MWTAQHTTSSRRGVEQGEHLGSMVCTACRPCTTPCTTPLLRMHTTWGAWALPVVYSIPLWCVCSLMLWDAHHVEHGAILCIGVSPHPAHDSRQRDAQHQHVGVIMTTERAGMGACIHPHAGYALYGVYTITTPLRAMGYMGHTGGMHVYTIP